MNDKPLSKLAASSTQTLLTEVERGFAGAFAFLLSLGVFGAFQPPVHLLNALFIMGALLFILYNSLRLFRVVRELRQRDKESRSENI